MIVIHHFIVHGGELTAFAIDDGSGVSADEKDIPLLLLVNGFCICAVNAFVLVSGYFGIKSSWVKACKLLFSIIFYTLLLTTGPLVIAGKFGEAAESLLFMSHTYYWFVIDYLFLMIFAPMINMAYDNWSKPQQSIFTLSLLLISCYFGFVWEHESNVTGYALFQFVTMYCIGRYISARKFNMRSWIAASGYIVCSIALGLSVYYLWRTGRPAQAWSYTYYNNPVNICGAICIVMWFKNLNFTSRIINRAASSVLAVYLVQESAAVSRVLYNYISEHMFSSELTVIEILGLFVAMAIVIMTLSIIFDKIPQALYKYLFRKVERKS